MTKRFWAITIKRSLLSFAVIFCAGILFDRLVTDPYDRAGPMAGVIAMGIYLITICVLGVLNLISNALYLGIFANNDLSAAVVDDLRRVGLPPPGRRDPKNYDYLAKLANDEEADASDRVKAAVLFGTYSAQMEGGLFRSLALRKAIDAAVLRYAKEAPQR